MQGDASLPYMSKLDAFDRFVSDTKYSPLGLCEVGEAKTSSQPVSSASRRHVVIVEDLPVGAESLTRVAQLVESIGER